MMGNWIQVSVRYYNVIRDAAGCDHEMLLVRRGSTLRELLRDVIVRRHPATEDLLFLQTGAVSPYTRFFWGEGAVAEPDLDRMLGDGDEIRLFPAVAGG